MVEFYQPKKRRGIAGRRTTTRVVEPKPYWPGLEIDEHDSDKSRRGIDNNTENTNTMKSNIETSANEGRQDSPKAIVSIERVEGSSAEGETKPSPSMNDSKKGNTNTNTNSRHVGGISTFRPRKRKRKPSINNNDVGDNAIPQLPGNTTMTGEEQEQEQGSDIAKNALVDSTSATSTTVGTANEVTRKCSHPIVNTTTGPSTTNSTGSLTNVSTNNNNHATAKATDAINTITPVPAKKTNTTNNYANNDNNNSDDQSSVSSSSDTRATPRVLVKFLLHQKFPLLDRVVSDIRDILTGMVSRSPALLQKHLAKTSTTTLPPLPWGNTGNNREINNGGIEDNDNASRSERNTPPQQETMSKLEDICKRQEMLLDRMTGMESAAARREEEFLKQTQEEKQAQQQAQQQKEQRQRQRQQEDSTAKLQRDYQTLQEANASLQMKLEAKNHSIETYRLQLEEKGKTIGELEGSKRSIHGTFQSRFDEQFRELSERECLIEKQRNLLKIARLENEKLRNRIGLRVLEEGRPRSAVETDADADADANHAYNSHRIRHANGQQDRYGNIIHGTTSSAYNPRIRRNARVRDTTL